MSDDPSSSMSMALRLAEWVEEFAGSPVSAASLEHTRLILLDSLGCALHARDDETAQARSRWLPRPEGRARAR